MKKLALALLTVIVLVTACLAFSGCGARTVKITTDEDLAKVGTPKKYTFVNSDSIYSMIDIESSNAELTCDLTIDTSGAYLGSSGAASRVYGKMTFEGNNHTITITGESNGTLGKYANLFVRRAVNCTFNNLNIVYKLPISMSSDYGSGYLGGLVSYAESCVFNNCSVTFDYTAEVNFRTDNYGSNRYSVGGIAGYADKCSFTNCSTVVKCNYTGRDFGGIVGRAIGCTVKNCDSDVTLTTSKLESGNHGGLIGYGENTKVSESWTTINQFTIKGKPQGWRNETTYSGLIMGTANGSTEIKNCYADLYCDYYTESGKSGLFKTTVRKGLITASASDKTTIRNVYVDVREGSFEFDTMILKGDKASEDTYLLTTRSFVYNNSSSNIENVYCLGHSGIFSIFRSIIYDTSWNVRPEYKYVFKYEDIDFDSSVIGETNVWTRDEDGKPVIAQTETASI